MAEVKLNSRPIIPNSLHWSEDNQIAILTPTAIHILTPVYGGSIPEHKTVYIPTGLQNPDPSCQFKAKLAFKDSDVQPSYAIAEVYRIAAWSPTGISQMNGCLLAVVTTSHRVLIYHSKNDPANSKWAQIDDLTEKLANLYSTDGKFLSKEKLNMFQTISIAWSTKIIYSQQTLYTSIIALGNKAGSITLWGYNTAMVKYLGSYSPQKSWLNALAWSRWYLIEAEERQAYLASSCVDGTVSICKVSARIKVEETELNMTQLGVWFHEDRRLPTVIKWFDDKLCRWLPKLAVAKGNAIHVWEATKPIVEIKNSDVDWKSFKFPICMCIAGMSWDSSGTRLHVFAMDGQYKTLCVLPTEIREDELHSQFVSHQMEEKILRQVELVTDEMDDEDEEGADIEDTPSRIMQPRIWGADASANGIAIAFVYSVSSSFYMEYKTEKYDTSSMDLCIAYERSSELVENNLIDVTSSLIKSPDLYHYNINHQLWDIFEYMEFGTMSPSEGRLLHKLLTALDGISQTISKDFISPNDPNQAKSSLGVQSLHHSLYRSPGINAKRIYLHIERNMKYIEVPITIRTTLGNNYNVCKTVLLQYQVQIVLEELAGMENDDIRLLSTQDQLMLLLYCDWTLQHTTHPQLLLAVKSTYMRLASECRNSSVFTDLKQEIDLVSDMIKTKMPLSDPNIIMIREQCPACNSAVPIRSALTATCLKGHIWGRCSLTMKLIPLHRVRSCIGCNSKSFTLEEYQGEGQSLTNLVINACDKCIYCFNIFCSKT